MKKNNKKKQLMLTVIGLVGLIAITVGVSIAFFNYTKAGTSDNTLTTGSVSFMYTEVTGIGRGIMLEDAIPMSDDLGKAQTGAGKVFDFKITSKTGNASAIPYVVTARMSSDSNLDTSKVRIYLEKDNEQVLLNNYGSLDQTDKVNSNTYTEKVLYEGKVPRNSENYVTNFKLKMWLSDAAISQNNEYPYNDKTFKITVNVYADGSVLTQQDIDLEQSANITSLSLGSNSPLTPIENGTYDYETTTTDRNITINVAPENPNAQVTIEKVNSFAYNEESNIKRLSNSSVTSQNITLTSGDNYIKITVTPEDRTVQSKIYKLHVTCNLPTYQVTLDGFNVTFDQSSPITILLGETTQVTVTPNLGFRITGATCTNDYIITGIINSEEESGPQTVIINNNNQEENSTCTFTTISAPVTLRAQILADNPTIKNNPTLSIRANETNEYGLYKMSVSNGYGGTDGDTYYFRGNVTNNVVKFGKDSNNNDLVWRIVRINEDGTVRLVLDSAINNNQEYKFSDSYGSVSNMYYSNSSIKTILQNWYNTNIDKLITGETTKKYSDYVKTGNYFCEAAKVVDSTNYNGTTGTTHMKTRGSYTPNLDCLEGENTTKYVNASVGLLTYDEVVLAGVGINSSGNNTYYLYKGVGHDNSYNWWTMSPAGFYGKYSEANVWHNVSGVYLNINVPSAQYVVRPVINLDKNVTIVKENDVYVVQY